MGLLRACDDRTQKQQRQRQRSQEGSVSAGGDNPGNQQPVQDGVDGVKKVKGVERVEDVEEVERVEEAERVQESVSAYGRSEYLVSTP